MDDRAGLHEDTEALVICIEHSCGKRILNIAIALNLHRVAERTVPALD